MNVINAQATENSMLGKRYIGWFIGCMIPLFLNAQRGQVGTWRDYLPYREVVKLVDAGDKVYGATPYSLIEINKAEFSASRLSKVSGLSDAGITDVAFHEPTQTVLVGYPDGKMDLIQGNRINTISDIERAALIGDKRINRFFIDGPFAYIACGFGIVLYNLEREEVAETFLIGDNASFLNVQDVTIHNGYVWAATVDGVYRAPENADLTLYQNWERQTNLVSADFREFIRYNDSLMVVRPFDEFTPDSVYSTADGSSWGTHAFLSGKELLGVCVQGDTLLVCTSAGVEIMRSDYSEERFVWTYDTEERPVPQDALYDANGFLWVADGNQGIIRSEREWVYDQVLLNGPYSIRTDRIAFMDGEVLVASGSKSATWTNTFSVDGVFRKRSDESWEYYNAFVTSGLDEVRDYVSIITHPREPGRYFVGTLGSGLLEFEGNELVTIHDESNSPLTFAEGTPNWVGVTGLAFDEEENLWVSNSINSQALSVYRSDGTWQSFSFSDVMGGETTGDIIVADNGYIWLMLPNKGQGILVLDYGQDLEDTTDDRWKILRGSAGNGGLPSTNVFCMAQDQDGEIWVGTEQGIAVFFSPGSVFEDNINWDAQQILVNFNGFFQYLLESEVVTAIAIDGANRKWIGTQNSGVFLMSEDGTSELYHFTSENSPLLSNTIRTLAVNSEDGEVLIGTEKGLVAFKGTSTGGSTLFEKVYAYPNPVKPGYTGPIAIKGLARGSNVKITDINGNLVFETYAEGGQAIWNGNRMDGADVATGVYLVFAIDPEGTEAEVTKILFIN